MPRLVRLSILTLRHRIYLAGYAGSFWASMLGKEQVLDTGPLWFICVRLILSLG